MKKRDISIIISVLLLLLSIVNGWFHDDLIDMFSFIWFGVDLIILICFIICFVSFIKHMRKKIINNIPVIICVITIIIVLFFPFRKLKINYELKIYEKERYEVIELVKNDKLELDTWGSRTAKLPKKYRKISNSGDIVIYKNDEAGIVVGFWVVRGMMSNGSILVIYSSETEQFAKENIDYLVKIKKLKDNWYYIETR